MYLGGNFKAEESSLYEGRFPEAIKCTAWTGNYHFKSGQINDLLIPWKIT